MYSVNLKKIMDLTIKEASEKSLTTYSLEMLVKNIISEKDVFSLLESEGINVENLIKEFESEIDGDNSIVQDEFRIEFNQDSNINPDEFAVDVLFRASLDIKNMDTERSLQINEYSILAATLMSENSPACKVLSMFDIKRTMFIDKILNQKIEEEFDEPMEMEENFDYGIKEFHQDGKDETSSFLTNMIEMAKLGSYSELIGRDVEMDRISVILGRKTKNNPIITGLAGVGKTAAIEGLALKILNGQSVDSLKEKVIYSLDLGALVAGTKYRGQLEERMVKVIEKVIKEKAILFIDEIHLIIGAGAASGSIDVSSQLLTHLSSGKLTVIGATTNEDYIKNFEKNPSISRRFNKVNFKELSEEQTISLMYSVKEKYEKYHNTIIKDGVIETIVKLSGRYINNNQFPDKALDILDEVSSSVKTDVNNKTKEINESDVLNVVSKIRNIPVEIMKNLGKNQAIVNLEKNILKNVFGQDHVVKKVSNAMKLAYSGLKRENKPIGSFLCIGPTGVGKTELAKSLSKELQMNLVRFDMSEYMQESSSNKFLGSAAGFVGYDDGALLSKVVKENPFSIMLFDEFEKAHPTIQNIFLQMLDEGKVTDSQGREIDFKNTIIIFTSNAGVSRTGNNTHGMGFSDEKSLESINMDKIKEAFSPEFRNRLSGIIEFNPLNKETLVKVANKGIEEVAKLLMMNKKIVIKWSKSVNEIIVNEGYDIKMGARPIERKIEELISMELADLILKENLKEGSQIKISKGSGKTLLKFTI